MHEGNDMWGQESDLVLAQPSPPCLSVKLFAREHTQEWGVRGVHARCTLAVSVCEWSPAQGCGCRKMPDRAEAPFLTRVSRLAPGHCNPAAAWGLK